MQNKLGATFRLARWADNKGKPVLNAHIYFQICWQFLLIFLCFLISVIKNLFLPPQKQAIKYV